MKDNTPNETCYDFSSDWFSMRIPLFEKYVAPLGGSPCALLEIGPYEGRSTTWLIDNALTHPESHLDSVDLHLSDKLRRNVDRTGRAQQVTLYEGLSREILRTLPLAFYDFIYIDGSHHTIDVLEDAILAFRLAKLGAVITFDDYLWDEPPWNEYGTPKPAIDTFLTLYAYPTRYGRMVDVIETGDSWQVWVRKVSDQPRPSGV